MMKYNMKKILKSIALVAILALTSCTPSPQDEILIPKITYHQIRIVYENPYSPDCIIYCTINNNVQYITYPNYYDYTVGIKTGYVINAGVINFDMNNPNKPLLSLYDNGILKVHHENGEWINYVCP